MVDVSNEVGLEWPSLAPGTAPHSSEEQWRHLQRVGNAREPGQGIHHMETAVEKQAYLVSSSLAISLALSVQNSLAGSGPALATSPVRGRGPGGLLVVSTCFCCQDPATPRVSPAHSPPENGLDKARGLKKDAPNSPASVASSSSTPSSKTKDHVSHVLCVGLHHASVVGGLREHWPGPLH